MEWIWTMCEGKGVCGMLCDIFWREIVKVALKRIVQIKNTLKSYILPSAM